MKHITAHLDRVVAQVIAKGVENQQKAKARAAILQRYGVDTPEQLMAKLKTEGLNRAGKEAATARLPKTTACCGECGKPILKPQVVERRAEIGDGQGTDEREKPVLDISIAAACHCYGDQLADFRRRYQAWEDARRD